MQVPTVRPLRGRLMQEISMAADNSAFSPSMISFIVDAYSEKWRQYHDIEHPLEMLDLLASIDTSLLSPLEIQAIKFMIFYHDVIYKLGRKEPGWSEEQSNKVAVAHLREAGYSELLVAAVTTGISATIEHSMKDVPEAWKIHIGIFLDLDLMAGLGKTWEKFEENTKRVGLEYSPLYTAQEFLIGRKAWAEKFAERPWIFHTAQFASYEPIVKSNLRRYVAES